MEAKRTHELSMQLLEPYILPPDSPYLSEDQLELCALPFQKRIEWMGEWLVMASGTR